MRRYHYSERLQRTLEHAREVAVGLNHEYIGQEHLLLALLRDTDGIPAAVLRAFSLNVEKAHQRILDAVKKGKVAHLALDLPYTSRGKKTLEHAESQSREWVHPYVGPEHLLIGMLRERNGIGAQVLAEAGVTLDGAAAHTLTLLGEQR